MIRYNFKKLDKKDKKDKKEVFIAEIMISIMCWMTLALYIWVGSYDTRFYNVTKNVKYVLVIISIIISIITMVKAFYYLVKFILKKIR